MTGTGSKLCDKDPPTFGLGRWTGRQDCIISGSTSQITPHTGEVSSECVAKTREFNHVVRTGECLLLSRRERFPEPEPKHDG
jgi:hypothetical protein